MPKGDKVASISFFKERSSDIKTVKTFCIYRQSRFTKIMPIICLLVIPAGLIIRIVKEMLSAPPTHPPSPISHPRSQNILRVQELATQYPISQK